MKHLHSAGKDLKGGSDRIARAVASVFSHVQIKWAAWMHRKTSRMTIRAKRICFAMFLLLSVSGSSYLVIKGIGTDHKFFKVGAIKTIQLPAQDIKGKLVITEAEYRKIERFKFFMDSLARSPSGKLQYDSILRRHPGIMDSIRSIQQLYHSQ